MQPCVIVLPFWWCFGQLFFEEIGTASLVNNGWIPNYNLSFLGVKKWPQSFPRVVPKLHSTNREILMHRDSPCFWSRSSSFTRTSDRSFANLSLANWRQRNTTLHHTQMRKGCIIPHATEQFKS